MQRHAQAAIPLRQLVRPIAANTDRVGPRCPGSFNLRPRQRYERRRPHPRQESRRRTLKMHPQGRRVRRANLRLVTIAAAAGIALRSPDGEQEIVERSAQFRRQVAPPRPDKVVGRDGLARSPSTAGRELELVGVPGVRESATTRRRPGATRRLRRRVRAARTEPPRRLLRAAARPAPDRWWPARPIATQAAGRWRRFLAPAVPRMPPGPREQRRHRLVPRTVDGSAAWLQLAIVSSVSHSRVIGRPP